MTRGRGGPEASTAAAPAESWRRQGPDDLRARRAEAARGVAGDRRSSPPASSAAPCPCAAPTARPRPRPPPSAWPPTPPRARWARWSWRRSTTCACDAGAGTPPAAPGSTPGQNPTDCAFDPARRLGLVVWDTSNDEKATLWGGVMTATAHGLEVKGAVIDGGIRGTHQILEKDFPAFHRRRIPNGSLGRRPITHYQIPSGLGDVTIKPGDAIMGDIDGILCAPRDIAYDVLARAEETTANGKRIVSWVAEGQSVQQITRQGGHCRPRPLPAPPT